MELFLPQPYYNQMIREKTSRASFLNFYISLIRQSIGRSLPYFVGQPRSLRQKSLKTNRLKEVATTQEESMRPLSRSPRSRTTPIRLGFSTPLQCQHKSCAQALTELEEWTGLVTHVCVCGQLYTSEKALDTVLMSVIAQPEAKHQAA